MVEIPLQNAGCIAPLFAGVQKAIPRAFLQGHMGRAWADDVRHPTCAKIQVGDFGFVAGNADAAGVPALAAHLPPGASEEVLLVPQNEAWAARIEQARPGAFARIERYAFENSGSFDKERLQTIAAALPEGYSLAPIDSELYARCLREPSFKDLCALFDNAADYAAQGLGFCALHNGEIAAGASSYTVYDDGIEIEVDTAETHRRKGLAAACAAALMLACLARGKRPYWDAANKASAALAGKLGYGTAEPYAAYAIAPAP